MAFYNNRKGPETKQSVFRSVIFVQQRFQTNKQTKTKKKIANDEYREQKNFF